MSVNRAGAPRLTGPARLMRRRLSLQLRKPTMQAPPAYSERYWTAPDGVTLFAREYAPLVETGEAVVCIPGLTRNSRDYEDVAPWLSGLGRRVICVDLRGRGRSQWAEPSSYRLPTYARDIVGLLDMLGLERAHVVGTSLGGMIAMQLAHSHLDRLAGAVLNDIGPRIEAQGIRRIGGYARTAPKVENWSSAVDYAKHIAGDAFPHYSEADWEKFTARMFDETPDGTLVPTYDSAVATKSPVWVIQLASLVAWRHFNRLAEHRPTLVLRGERSDILSRQTVARMARKPGVTAVEIAGAAHTPDLTEAASTAVLSDFFLQVG